MGDIKAYMTEEHKRCDDNFAAAEKAVTEGDWAGGTEEFNRFREAMEEATGMTDGPTAVMRSEHDEMRRLFEQMTIALDAQYEDEYFDTAEMLLILMQQHNMKEEQMLYEMADRQFGGEANEVLTRMRQIQ